VNPSGLTFAKALRSFLRQDPDIILVGEIRDLETAQIAVQASLTGHLVLSDAAHQRRPQLDHPRLLDLGMEAFLLTATVEGIVAQRLVRTICTSCKERTSPEEELMELALTPDDVRGKKFSRGKGCDAATARATRVEWRSSRS
jgi:type IV pilus assembly protein PilB